MVKRDLKSKHTLDGDFFDKFIADFIHPAILLTLDGKIQKFSTALLELYNLSSSELTNQNFFELFPRHNIDLPFSSTHEMLASPKTPITTVKTNRVRSIQWSASLIMNNREQNSIFLTGLDVSDFINASKKEIDIKNSIIDYIPNHYIFWKDINSVYLGCNAALAATIGLDSSAEIVGKTDYDLPTTKAQSDAYRADDKVVMNSGVPKLNIEEHQTLASGEHRVLSTSKAPLFDERGNVYGVLAIYSDITERKNMELSLEKAKNQAEMANLAKTEFIANMSHDIRTPLSGIVGMSKLLEDMVITPDEKQYARWINESGEQLLDLLNGVLDVVSAENVKETDIHEEPFSLRKSIRDIGQLELPTAIMKGLRFKTEVNDNVPEFIITDQTKLHRILLNLLGNAIKFTETGHIKIRVEQVAANLDDDTAELKFSVIDSGIGIAEELKDKVFDRFYRANPSFKGTYRGHGVGLHIAQKYVELLGSKIDLTSRVGVGTTFFFILSVKIERRAPGSAPVDDQTLLTHEPIVLIDQLSSTKYAPTILLVEDNIVALRLIEVMTTQSGVKFISAVDGEQALELAKTHNFDLIITDVGLPGISGYELTSAIRAWEKQSNLSPVPIVGLTAHALHDAEKECLQSGMNTVMCKPINLKKIKEIVHQYALSAKGEHPVPTPLTEKKAANSPQKIMYTEHELFNLEHFPLFDHAQGMKNIGQEALLQEVIQLMLKKEIPECEASLQQAYTTHDWERIEKIAHKLKGGAVYCGALKLQYACQSLERYYKSAEIVKPASLEALYTQLMQVISQTTQTLAKLHSSLHVPLK